MKIAIVINKSWNIYNFRRSLIRAFHREGCEVITIAPRDEYSEKLEKEGSRFVHIPIQSHGLDPFTDLLLLFRFYVIYRRIKPDVVIHYTIKPNIYGAIAARMAGIPSINNVTGLGTVFLHKNPLFKIAKFMYWFSFRFPEKIFFQNKDDQDLFGRTGLVNIDKTDVVPGSGIDTERFSPKPFVRHERFTFLLIARMLYDKGILEYIDAIRILKGRYPGKMRFLLLGGADPSNSLAVPIKQLNKWQREGLVEYLGFRDNVVDYVYESDCVVLPSYREGLPKSLLEAMSTAKPIITTDVPGCREVVEDGMNGYICESHNHQALADQMEKMYLLPDEKLQKMGERSRQIVLERYDESFVIEKYLQAAKAMVSRKNQKNEIY